MGGKRGKGDGTSGKSRAKLLKEWDMPPEEALRWRPGDDVHTLDTSSTPGWDGTRKQGMKLVAVHARELSDLQEKLFAYGRTGGKRSILLVLQGLDTAGKGGIVRHVVGLVDPQGLAIRGFGVPTPEEAEHGYLWRIRNALPQPGFIGVFDRSHHEQVLVVRVHGLEPEETWRAHYDELNEFEAEVMANGTTIVKVALMISRDEQYRRLSKRLDRPDKHWKFTPADIDSRLKLPAYLDAYQELFERTSTREAPWHVVPADHKWFARLAASELLLNALRALDLDWPAAPYDLTAQRLRLEAS